MLQPQACLYRSHISATKRACTGFFGLSCGCTLAPSALAEVPRCELQSLLQPTPPVQVGASSSAAPALPDMQTYTLELLMQAPEHEASAPEAMPPHRVRHYPANDVPADLSELFGFLREQAWPVGPRQAGWRGPGDFLQPLS